MRKLFFCAAALLCLPLALSAQELRSSVPSAAVLPEDPSTLAAVSVAASAGVFPASFTSSQQPSSSSSDAQQTPAPPAQQTPAPDAQQAPSTPATAQDQHAEAERELKQEETQRMLGIMPAFNAVLNGKAVPLTPGQKFHLFFRGSIDPFQFFIVGVDATLEQAQNSYPEYRQGVEGFAKRYGASYADDFDGNFFGNALLPVLLHQDPRYFRLGHGTFWHRLLYSASTTVRAKGDNGKWQPNYSNLGGNFIGGAISNLYYPASDRGVTLTLERGITVSAEGAIGAFAIEFYPDFEHMMARRHQRALERRALKDAPNSSHTYPSQP